MAIPGERLVMRPRDVPAKHRGLYERARWGKSRRAAMRVFCLECVGWKASEVVMCTDRVYPLYPYRLGGAPKLAPDPSEGVHAASGSDAAGSDGTPIPGNA